MNRSPYCKELRSEGGDALLVVGSLHDHDGFDKLAASSFSEGATNESASAQRRRNEGVYLAHGQILDKRDSHFKGVLRETIKAPPKYPHTPAPDGIGSRPSARGEFF